MNARSDRRESEAIGARPDSAAGGTRTVLRAFALLELLVAEPRGLGLNEIARRAGLNKATVYRLLAALRTTGLVVQDRSTALYRPGLKLVARPYVERLSRELGHGVLSGVLEGPHIVSLDHVPGRHPLRVHRQAGARVSVHVSSMRHQSVPKPRLSPRRAKGRRRLGGVEVRRRGRARHGLGGHAGRAGLVVSGLGREAGHA
jgi:DNA-binding transcriptional ArsR family regulator